MTDDRRTGAHEVPGPAAVPGMAPGGAPAGGPVSERMQALLSRAVEDQVAEQRQVSGVLADLRAQVNGLSDGLRSTATAGAVERLAGELAAQASEVRRTYALLTERLDGLARRMEDTAAAASSGGKGAEHLSVRVTGLAADLSALSSLLQEVASSVGTFPDSVASVQRDLAGLHDRVGPIADLREEVSQLATRPGAEGLLPEIAGLRQLLAGVASQSDLDRVRDSVVQGVGNRLERLEAAVARPSVTHDDLRDALSELRGQLDPAESLSPVTEQLTALQERWASLADRVTDIGDAAGGVPAVATDLARLAGRVEEAVLVRQEVAALRVTLAAVSEEVSSTAVPLAVAGLRGEVEALSDRLAALTYPTPEQVAAEVAPRVADRLVDGLAPRVSDLVLTRVGAVLVDQVSAAAAAQVLTGMGDVLREANTDSERRVLAHVDEAVLALAEALLRRRRPGRPDAVAAGLAPGPATTPTPAAVGLPAAVTPAPATAPPAVPSPPAEVSALDQLAAELEREQDAALLDDGLDEELDLEADPELPTGGQPEATPDSAFEAAAAPSPAASTEGFGQQDAADTVDVDDVDDGDDSGDSEDVDDAEPAEVGAALEAQDEAQDEAEVGLQLDEELADEELADEELADEELEDEELADEELEDEEPSSFFDQVAQEPEPATQLLETPPPAAPAYLEPSPDLVEDARPVSTTTRVTRPGVTGGMAPPRPRATTAAEARAERERQTLAARQPPPAAPPPPPPEPEDDDEQRRRPWWRPGG